MTFANVTPAFPYEGALFWLFAERRTDSYEGEHPYYRNLYGPNHQLIISRASALACLFDMIVIAPADARFPDVHANLTGDLYSHPDLRLSSDFKYNEWDKENKKMSKWLLRNKNIQKLFEGNSHFSDTYIRHNFLCRVLLQIRVADANNAVLVGNSFFNQIYNETIRCFGESDLNQRKNALWTLDLSFMDIFGLDFGSTDIDTFAAVRQTKEISAYANAFRDAISQALPAQDLKQRLLQIMKEALEHENIARRTGKAFQTVGSVANVGGLIPFVGTITTGIGIGADVSSRVAQKVEADKQWYLLGPKMKEVALKDLITRV